MYRKFFKRFFDFLLAIIGVLILSFPMLIIAIAIRMDSKGPVIFKQKREGKHRKQFIVYKFRTMCDKAYEIGGIVETSIDSRITRVGSFLRRTSLDEIPQLFNIIKGEMSIIGPRPILDWEFDQYAQNSQYQKRFSVLPGLFCLVDLDYRATADRDTQFLMDSKYSDTISFKNDFILFFGIIKTVLSGKNVYKNKSK